MYTDEEIAKAFNAGYTMQQFDPKMIDKILDSNQERGEIMQAMSKGAERELRDKMTREQQANKQRKENKKKGR